MRDFPGTVLAIKSNKDCMPPKVLLVDDDPLMHRLYQPHIERAGYQLLSTFTGSEAIEVSIRESPRVIIIDIMLPKLDGLSVVREFRRIEETKNIPIIVITASPQYYLSHQESQSAGATLFLTKPFSPVNLVSAIQRFAPLPGSESDVAPSA